jgi:hypothetical protein
MFPGDFGLEIKLKVTDPNGMAVGTAPFEIIDEIFLKNMRAIMLIERSRRMMA